MREESSTPVRALYDVPEAMALLSLSRTQIYELIRSRRLVTVTRVAGGWCRLTRSRSTYGCSCGSRAVMMVARRSRGEGSLFWNEKRQRWIGIVSQGYAASGKRRTTWVSGRTKTEAKTKLREAQRARDDGLPAGRRDYTVRQAVESWLEHGLAGRDRSTVRNRTILARRHVLPALGSRRLAELTADEVDRWLTGESKWVSTDTLAKLLSILRQSIRRAQAHDLVQRNVALLCDAPKGTAGRPSKSLRLEQAGRLLAAAEGRRCTRTSWSRCSPVPVRRN